MNQRDLAFHAGDGAKSIVRLRRGFRSALGALARVLDTLDLLSEISGYSAAGLDFPKGEIKKGIVVRIIKNGNEADLRNIAWMCLDASVRPGKTTVIPAPFKILAEWRG